MSYNPEPFHPFDKYDGQVSAELEQANENFRLLAKAFKDSDPTTLIVKDVAKTDQAGKTYNSFFLSPYCFPSNIFTVLTKSNLPQFGMPYAVYYSVGDNKLYYTDGSTQWNDSSNKYISAGYGSKWFEVDWTKWVVNDPWYKAGKLVIHNGELLISNAGGWVETGVNKGWTKIIPTVGEKIIYEVDPDPEYNYSTPYNGEKYILYLAPGQSVVLKELYNQFFNIACVSPSYWRCSVNGYPGGSVRLYGIMPSGKAISDGKTEGIMSIYEYTEGDGTGNNPDIFRVKNIAPVFKDLFFVPITMAWKGNITNFDIYVNDGKMFIISNGSFGDYTNDPITTALGECIFTSRGTFPSDGYYIGKHAFKFDGFDTLSTGSLEYADEVIITRIF